MSYLVLLSYRCGREGWLLCEWHVLTLSRFYGLVCSNQPPSVAPRSGATRELVALRLERGCSVLFTPIHLQIRIDNFFGIAEFRYLYGVDTGNQSRSN